MSDRLFMHFKKEEDVQNLTGKLEDELLRIHRIVESATLGGIPIMNESFFDDLLSSYADSP
jgi:DNA mismatch repair protein MutS